ncbi:MAG: hypothetical protein A3C00_03420 [Candidatus Jacksonbacteria bacterium RIFCSPHIGHO2_02_FULL_44_25]|nr:MAG: hypothetical protein A3E05_01640 [Candidatus Jacksonbacteria bacterium RIFCSPHIGHO2_12_FULL_44_12]OGY72023.1 MAG: hypothetical protein A3C00_03420 [Candidatus Jacksonbacteria bacterium RIFCSPHIGHO2_02_FULL_44_25]
MYYGARYYHPTLGRFTQPNHVITNIGRKEFDLFTKEIYVYRQRRKRNFANKTRWRRIMIMFNENSVYLKRISNKHEITKTQTT